MTKDHARFVVGLGVMGALIVTGCMEGGGDRASGRLGDEVHEAVRVEGVGVDLYRQMIESGGLPVHLTGENHSVQTVGQGPIRLIVHPSGGAEPIEFVSETMKAEFRHQGRLLIVTILRENDSEAHYFYEPIRWSAHSMESSKREEGAGGESDKE